MAVKGIGIEGFKEFHLVFSKFINCCRPLNLAYRAARVDGSLWLTEQRGSTAACG